MDRNGIDEDIYNSCCIQHTGRHLPSIVLRMLYLRPRHCHTWYNSLDLDYDSNNAPRGNRDTSEGLIGTGTIISFILIVFKGLGYLFSLSYQHATKDVML